MFRKTLTLSDARQALSDAEVRLADWRRQAEEAERHRTQVEARLGEDALAATDGGAAIREALNTARIDFDVATAAVPAAEVKVHEARQDVLLAAAVELRGQATDKHAEAGRHRERTTQLLAELEAHEGAKFMSVVHVKDQVRGIEYFELSPSTISDRTEREGHELTKRADALEQLAGRAFSDREFDQAVAKVDGGEAIKAALYAPTSDRVPVA